MPAPLSRLRTLFHQLVEAAPEDRGRLLEAQCGGDAALREELEALLAQHEKEAGFLAEPTLRMDDGVGTDPLAWLGQRSIGPYYLLERIGEGGWGEVFMAEQREPVKRRVALKILKAGMDSRQIIARFEAERQALALMEHPGIARVFDAGATPQGRPFFVMELVDGMPISDYCARHNVAAGERLRLFTEVCRAVQHAHGKGIIHRDLKPSNILVTETDGRPAPKVIDFGIAKATGGGDAPFTAVRQLIGTPAYMSPEQASLAEQQLDTRSDIYSLGVVLYELLTGVTPFDSARLRAAALAEMHRIISEEPPPKPSTRAATLIRTAEQAAPFAPPVPERLLRGDLDWIVMKALEKEPARRYETAAAFAEDILRHLAHEPVTAGPPSALYRFRKFARRHRRGMAAACIALTGLIAGLVLALREAAARKVQAERAESLLRLQSQIFETANPESARGEDYTVRELLNDFSAQFQHRMGVEPDVEISLRQTLGRAFQALARGRQSQTDKVAELEKSDLQVAEHHFRAALALAVQEHGAESTAAAACLHDLGWVLHDQGRYSEARPELEKALRIRESEAGGNHPLTLTTRAFLAAVLLKLNEPDKALALAQQSVQWREAGAEAIRPLQTAAQVCMERGDLATAAQAAGRALELARQADGGSEAARSILPLQTLAAVRLRENRSAEAANFAQRAVTVAERIYGADHRLTLNAKSVLQDVQSGARTADANAAERQGVFDALRKTLGEEHPETFRTFVDLLGSVIQSNPDGARGLVFSMMGSSQAERDAGEAVPVSGMNEWARKILTRGNLGDFEVIMRKALDIIGASYGETHRNTIDVERGLAFIHVEQKRYDEAAAIYRRSLAKCEQAFGPGHALTCEASLLLAQNWILAGRFGDFETAVAGLPERLRSRPPQELSRASQLEWLGYTYTNTGRWSAALPVFAESSAFLRAQGNQPARLADSLYRESLAMRRLGWSARHLEPLREALELCRRDLGEKDERTWQAAAALVSGVRSSLRWRDAIPLVEDFTERAAANLSPSHKYVQSLQSLAKILTANGERQAQRAAAAAAAWAQAVAEKGEDSPEALEKLRQLALMQGNTGDYAAVQTTLAAYAKGIAALADAPAPLRDDPAVLEAWFGQFFAGHPDGGANERVITEAVRRLSAEDAAGPHAEKLLQRAMSFFRAQGRGHEYFQLADAVQDRRLGEEWEPARVVWIVPRGVVWKWTPAPAAESDWHSRAALDENLWRRGESPLGAPVHLVLTDLERPGGADAAQPVCFRRVFPAPAAPLAKLKLRLRYLDGMVVWLNGREVFRDNVSAGADYGQSSAREMLRSVRSVAVILPAEALRPGENLLAAALYNVPARKTLDHAVFDAVLEGLRE